MFKMNNETIIKRVKKLRNSIWNWDCLSWDCKECPFHLGRNNCLCDRLKDMIDKRLEQYKHKTKICSKCGQELKED